MDWRRHAELRGGVEEINGALKKELKPLAPRKEGTPDPPTKAHRIVEFLHISDAQIRDESMYENSPADMIAFKALDPFVDVTLRRPLVERFDSTVLAAFLAAYAKDDKQRSESDDGRSWANRFIVHTGDLIDISLATELIEGLQVMRQFSQHFPDMPLLSVTGNHDGLTFGNIPDKRSDTRGLGINKGEFVNGHLLQDPGFERGFGFGLNELVRQGEGACRAASKRGGGEKLFCNEIRSGARLRKRLRESPDQRKQLSRPLAFRSAVDFSGTADRSELRMGYYSWSVRASDPATKKGMKGIKFIVLDTRSGVMTSGRLDPVQLGWLYNELSSALAEREGVIVFAHNPPDDVRPRSCVLRGSRGGCVLRALLRRFPNVVAYVYGHEHESAEAMFDGYALIQTGSLADFPQVGRRIRVARSPGDDSEALIQWDFVRPDASTKKPSGLLVDGVLSSSRKDAEKEFRSERPCWRPFVSKLVPTLKFDEIGRWQDWRFEHLKGGHKHVQIGFAFEGLTPETFFGAAELDAVNEQRKRLKLLPVEVQGAGRSAAQLQDWRSWPIVSKRP